MESGDTSSMNYYTIHDNNKYLLFDSPGNKKYSKTLWKMIKNINYNIVIFFSGEELEYYKSINDYFKSSINTKIIYVNYFGFNITKNNFIDKIKSNIIDNEIVPDNKVKFNVLQTFYNNDIILLSGFLKQGRIKISDKLKWESKYKYDIKVISIQGSNNNDNNNISLNEINCPLIATLCVKTNNVNFNKKVKYGYVYK